MNNTFTLAALVFAAISMIRKQWPNIDGITKVLPLLAVISILTSWAFGDAANISDVFKNASGIFVLALAGAEAAKRARNIKEEQAKPDEKIS